MLQTALLTLKILICGMLMHMRALKNIFRKSKMGRRSDPEIISFKSK